MPDYKDMYLQLFRATEEAIQILISAQQKCEEMYISSALELNVFPFQEENEDVCANKE